MNHQLWTAVGGRVLALAFVLAGAAACGDDAAERTSRITNGDTNTTAASNGDTGARNDVFAGPPGTPFALVTMRDTSRGEAGDPPARPSPTS